ncbi:MAG: PilZ domain-containing protein [Alcanivoracaceae bacterium]|nr:PilZ domain-containing protein [Alcanivoracaceae bacterium]
MSNPEDKRRFSRVPFEGTARLHIGERLLPVELLDISVRGAQIRLPHGESVRPDDECRLTLTLDDSPIHLTLESQVRHISDDQAGLIFVLIDVSDMQHLRRIVELNLGDDDAVKNLVGK